MDRTRIGGWLYASIALAAIIAAWQGAILLFDPPSFLLPPPHRVFGALSADAGYFAGHAVVTLVEMLGGLVVGSLAGIAAAVLLARSVLAERLLLPVIVTTQTLPVFAIAPILVIWFGFGAGSKIVMAALIIFFPVASSFYDGLKRIDREWIDLARSWGAGNRQILLKVRAPAALPSLASGMRIAATLAPIGAVVGEWAGASGGLGYVMLQANARMETDKVFASLIVLAAIAYALRLAVSGAADRIVFWQISQR